MQGTYQEAIKCHFRGDAVITTMKIITLTIKKDKHALSSKFIYVEQVIFGADQTHEA